MFYLAYHSRRKWDGRSGFYFIFLFNLKAHFCFSIIDFIYIYNGKRKLKFAAVSANLADCQFLICFVNISWKMWKKVYRRGIVESVGRVTVNAHAIFPSSLNLPRHFCLFYRIRGIWEKTPQNLLNCRYFCVNNPFLPRKQAFSAE